MVEQVRSRFALDHLFFIQLQKKLVFRNLRFHQRRNLVVKMPMRPQLVSNIMSLQVSFRSYRIVSRQDARTGCIRGDFYNQVVEGQECTIKDISRERLSTHLLLYLAVGCV